MADNNSNGIYTIIGGLISSVSGLVAVGVRVRLDKKTEITNIKLILIDDMENIVSIIDKMIETCKKTHTISNDYLNELNEIISAYYPQKHRILLINNSEVRKNIKFFYKSLDETIKDSLNKVGSLNIQDQTSTHDRISEKFEAVKKEADQLKKEIEKIKYKVYYLF